jgi:DNA-binding MurR/RpiR family transcriptional regulator
MTRPGPASVGQYARPVPTTPLVMLEASIPHLPGAAARAALYIVENADKVIGYSLKDLSGFSRTGEASIVRLCQTAGFTGFSDFKLALAAELAVRRTGAHLPVPAGGTTLSTIADELARSITATAMLVDQSLLQSLAPRLRDSNRIDLYGAGVSGMVAELFSYRLLRAGLNAHAIRDGGVAHEVANGLTAASAAIAISESGLTPDTLDFLKVALLTGAFTIAVTCNIRSPLAKQAHAVLPMAKLNIPAYGGFINAVPRAVYIAEALAAVITSSD